MRKFTHDRKTVYSIGISMTHHKNDLSISF